MLARARLSVNERVVCTCAQARRLQSAATSLSGGDNMKHSISWLRAAIGPAALIPLAVACSHRQAETPSGGTTPETGVSAQMGQEGQGKQPGSVSGDQGSIGQPGQLSQQGRIGDQGQSNQGQSNQGQSNQGNVGQPSPYGDQGFGAGLGEQPGQQGESAMSEKSACDALANSAKLRVEDVQGGVSIVATPKTGQDLSTVKDDARHLETAIHGAHGAQGETCGIAELGRLPSVTAQVVEGVNSVRINMTTNNAGEVKDLRRIARDEVQDLAKGNLQLRKQQPK
jgi:hypothetical protein